jgi:plastocyanin
MKKALPILIIAIIVIAGLTYYFVNKNNSSQYGNNAGNSTSPQTKSTPPQTSNNSSSTPQTTDKVTIRDMMFSPADITVKTGTTVTWTNQDSIAHTVVETDGQNGPKSDTLEPNESYSFTYETAGTFKYHCSIHPNMTGAVTVTE